MAKFAQYFLRTILGEYCVTEVIFNYVDFFLKLEFAELKFQSKIEFSKLEFQFGIQCQTATQPKLIET